MLGAFHGERMEALTDLLGEVAAARGRGVAARRADRAALAASGADAGGDPAGRLRPRERRAPRRAARPHDPHPRVQRPSGDDDPGAPGQLGDRGPWARFERLRAEADELVFGLIEERRRRRRGPATTCWRCCWPPATRTAPRCRRWRFRDELMTLLVAGHETTASELAWAFERLLHDARRAAAADRARSTRRLEDAYLTATVQETLRRRPVLPERAAAPRQGAGRGRRLDLPGGRLPRPQRLPGPPRPGDLPGALRLPPRALPLAVARHLHLDPLRRRPPPLPRRQLRDLWR